MLADPPRNWRVNWLRCPSGISTDVSRQVVLEVVTDFGERVGSESFDGESVSVDLVNLGISLSLHPDIIPAASLFDDVWSRGQEAAHDSGGGGGIADIVLEAFADMQCSRALDAGQLAVGKDGCARAWIRIRAAAQTRRGFSHLRIRARCTYNRAPVHAGGGIILSAWSPTCVLMGEGDAKQPAMVGEEALQARSLTFGSFKGHQPLPLWLYEDVRTRSTGGNLWDVAMIIGEVVAACYAIWRIREEGGQGDEESCVDVEGLEGGWKLLVGDPRQVGLVGDAFKHGGRVAELGAGTGAVGLLCGMAGAGEVVFTDNDEEVLSLLRMNAAANLGGKGCKGKAPPHHHACTSSSSSSSPSSSWEVKKLVWGEEPSSRGSSDDDGKGEERAGLGHFDLIVASECVYAEVGFYPLCKTLLSLSSETSRIILGFRSRDAKAEALVKELLGQHFIISSISVERAPRHLPRFCEQGGVEIYALRRRLECDVPRPPALSALARYLVAQGDLTPGGSGKR